MIVLERFGQIMDFFYLFVFKCQHCCFWPFASDSGRENEKGSENENTENRENTAHSDRDTEGTSEAEAEYSNNSFEEERVNGGETFFLH